eukprot:15365365-Ditylum_brightwellii.AAC.2
MVRKSLGHFSAMRGSNVSTRVIHCDGAWPSLMSSMESIMGVLIKFALKGTIDSTKMQDDTRCPSGEPAELLLCPL